MPVSGVSPFPFTLVSAYELPWYPVVHCTSPCTTATAVTSSRGIRPRSFTAWLPQAVGDLKASAMRGSEPECTMHACLGSTTGLDLRHQYEPVVLGEVEEVVGVEGFIWNLMATQICNGWHAGWLTIYGWVGDLLRCTPVR